MSKSDMRAVTVPLTISEKDFENLTNTSMEWGSGWRHQADRFECTDGCRRTGFNGTRRHNPRWTWGMAYWIVDDWAQVMLARTFLEGIGEKYEIIWDMAPNPQCQYVILTNYRALHWQRADHLEATALWAVRLEDGTTACQDGRGPAEVIRAYGENRQVMHRDTPSSEWHEVTGSCPG